MGVGGGKVSKELWEPSARKGEGFGDQALRYTFKVLFRRGKLLMIGSKSQAAFMFLYYIPYPDVLLEHSCYEIQ